MKSAADRHEFDYRPRFIEADHELIQALARKLDIPPNVLVRQLARAQLHERTLTVLGVRDEAALRD